MTTSSFIHLAVFASGGGSNARELLTYFSEHPRIRVALLCTNNPQSGVWDMGKESGVPVELLRPKQYADGEYLGQLMAAYEIDVIALAGYLKKIPDSLIHEFPNRILNIHPALLPAYGGRGMYGMHIHKAVIAAGETQSGITIHYVNEVYDAGEIIFQHAFDIPEGYSATELQKAILKLEHQHYPGIVEKVCLAIPS